MAPLSLDTARSLLRVGALPSSALLHALCATGFSRLVNVSGVDLRAVYCDTNVDTLEIHQFVMRDVFASAAPLEALDRLDAAAREDPARYLDLATPSERDALGAAVSRIASVLGSRSKVFVFCHLGRSRSPLVAACALGRVLGLPPVGAMLAVSRLHPEACFTRVSLAAAWWLSELKSHAR